MTLERQYYLETSSVRKASVRTAGKRLQDIAPIAQCFTSAFVLFELVTGLDESGDEFNYRKASIANLWNLQDSGLHIDWMLPKDRAKAAYPFLQHKPDVGKFCTLIKCVKGSSCMQEFHSILAQQHMSDYFTSLKREHADIAGYVPSKLREAPSLIECADRFVEEQWPSAGDQEKRAIRRGLVGHFPQFRKAMGHADVNTMHFARQWAGECIPNATEYDVKRTCDSYNGSITLFLEAFDLFLQKCKSVYNVGENDFADVLHLLYLDKGNVLVSEERGTSLIASIAREIGISLKRVGELQGN